MKLNLLIHHMFSNQVAAYGISWFTSIKCIYLCSKNRDDWGPM